MIISVAQALTYTSRYHCHTGGWGVKLKAYTMKLIWISTLMAEICHWSYTYICIHTLKILMYVIGTPEWYLYGKTTANILMCCKTQSTTSRCGLRGRSLKWPSENWLRMCKFELKWTTYRPAFGISRSTGLHMGDILGLLGLKESDFWEILTWISRRRVLPSRATTI